MSDTKKCAHPACSCTVTGGAKYCSQVCEDAKSMIELKCHCNHPGCEMAGI